jgi:single-strand DNA-binding protein
MNKVVLMGRLTRNPDVKYSQGESPMAIARYTLAVNRRFHRDGQQEADFISCVAFGKQGEFVEKYLKKGTKIVVSGRIQTGSYVNREGVTVYTTEVVVDEHDFAESLQNQQTRNAVQSQPAGNPGPAGYNPAGNPGGNYSQPVGNPGYNPAGNPSGNYSQPVGNPGPAGYNPAGNPGGTPGYSGGYTAAPAASAGDGFMSIPSGGEDLPFSDAPGVGVSGPAAFSGFGGMENNLPDLPIVG